MVGNKGRLLSSDLTMDENKSYAKNMTRSLIEIAEMDRRQLKIILVPEKES